LYWLIGLRVAAVTALLGLSIVLPLAKKDVIEPFSGLIVSTYLLSLAYLLVLYFARHPRSLIGAACIQLGGDLVLETLLVAWTGGVGSPFSVLYFITVMLASLTLGRGAGLVFAGTSVVLLGLVTDLQLGIALTPATWVVPSHLTVPQTFHMFFLYVLTLLVVGYLSGTLSENLRRAGQSLATQQVGLQRLLAFHENVVQSISSGLFTTDSAGRITSFNPAAAEATGYSSKEALGRLWPEVFGWPPAGPAGRLPQHPTTPYRFEAVGKKADGSRLIVGMTLSPLTEQGVQTGLVGVFKDLTQIRDMEDEIRRREWLATLGEMSAGMAHEIRNPLAAIGAAMQMLRRDRNFDETSARLVDIAIREMARLDMIIKAFLAYAKPPALNLKECDINAVLSETLDLIRQQTVERPDLSIIEALARGPLLGEIDPDQMKQVFWNLASNAFQAMPKGGRLLIGSSVRKVSSGEWTGDVAEIAFEDTGEGIRAEDLDKIFLPFFTTKKDGSGLGLAAVHRIVDLHGGWIRVHSEPGKGSRFVVCVPKKVEDGLRLWDEGREPWSRGPWKKS
jgi:two-component system sensor histidine kinase PilS (NtrC family)